ncbi:hypothetical protein QH639_18300 [Lysinibacillus sp. 1 U-2021]|uniref:hypothetical protein n=1 Tax=Lysinibacillus sp. 1 U-2021 TaxID=3039426 RepID=UPI002480CC82|nr:hypothetical protein [Lysinibacillus sp. 1 U-2021]WGT37772.1 hypothetical protein QH639_18300 [Lysinibacillus sp. 1 U-2021]
MTEMKYYEFNKHEYYALIKAKTAQKSMEIYVENVAGESVEQIKNEGTPDLLNKYDAFVKYGLAPKEVDENFEETVKYFEEETEGLLLIDGSLL